MKTDTEPRQAGFQVGFGLVGERQPRAAWRRSRLQWVSGYQAILDFLQSTYIATADLAHWNRAEPERP